MMDQAEERSGLVPPPTGSACKRLRVIVAPGHCTLDLLCKHLTLHLVTAPCRITTWSSCSLHDLLSGRRMLSASVLCYRLHFTQCKKAPVPRDQTANTYSLIPSISVRSALASVMAAWIDVSYREQLCISTSQIASRCVQGITASEYIFTCTLTKLSTDAVVQRSQVHHKICRGVCLGACRG